MKFGWEPIPGTLGFIHRRRSSRGLAERSRWPLVWRNAREQDWPSSQDIGADFDFARRKGTGFVSETEVETLYLIDRDWFGWPDPPRWALASRSNPEGTWNVWGSFDDLPRSWSFADQCVRPAGNSFEHESATVPPGALFVAADEPLLVFSSVREAESSLEAIDVEDGVYPAAYGPNGEPYSVGSTGNRVVIEPTGEPNRPEDLRALLMGYLQRTGQTFSDEASTPELVQQAWKTDSEFWQEYDPFGDRFSNPAPLSCCAAVVFVPTTVLYVAVTRDWLMIPFVILMALFFWGVAQLARRKADQTNYRRG